MESSSRPMASSTRKRPREKRERTTIVIPLHRKPPDYVPGTGPKLQRIGLLPLQDSTAYVLDRILLPSPGLAKDGKPLPKRMAYLVGWHDLPAARVMVPAMQVLDYVSPRALEQWEGQMEQELDEERAKLEAEAKTKKVAQVQAPAPRKPGRPPKHSQIEAAVVAAPEPEGMAAVWQKEGVMSITSPTKTRVKDFWAEGNRETRAVEESDEDPTPSLQLERELQLRSGLNMAMDVDSGAASEEVEMADALDTLDGIHQATDSGISSLSKHGNGGERTNTPVHPLQNEHPREIPNVFSLRPSPLRPPPRAADSTHQMMQHRTSFTPASGTPSRAAVGFEKTDAMGAVRAEAKSAAPQPAPAAETSSKPKSRGPGRMTKTPKEKTPKEKPPREQAPTEKTPRGKAPKEKTPPPPPEGEDGEPVWEVKRLEDHELYEVEGRGLVRYFKVRWEGDWPADQNPSWEPEENLPADLVRNYLKRPKKRQALPAPKKQKKQKQTTLSWTNVKQYKSVSEAFAGDAEDSGMDYTQMDHAEDNTGDDDERDELFVVEEPEQSRSRSSWAAQRKRSMELGIFSMPRQPSAS